MLNGETSNELVNGETSPFIGQVNESRPAAVM